MLVIISLLLGCVKNTELTSYNIDPDLEILPKQCVSSDFDECDKVKEINTQVEKMIKLHNSQMSVFESSLLTFTQILSEKTTPPIIHVSSTTPDTDTWNDPNGVYPVELIARLQYDRGMDRIDEALGKKFINAVSSLVQISEDIDQTWNENVKAFPVVLPEDILRERQPISVTVKTLEKEYQFSVPIKHQSLLPQKLDSWAAMVSHVGHLVEDENSKQTTQQVILSENNIDIQNAFGLELVKEGENIVSVSITESPKLLQYLTYTSNVLIQDFCKDIRAEARFTYGDEVVLKKVSLVNK